MAKCDYEKQNDIICQGCDLKIKLRHTESRGSYASLYEASKLGYSIDPDNPEAIGNSDRAIKIGKLRCKKGEKIPVYGTRL